MNQYYNDGYLQATNDIMASIEAKIERQKNCSCPTQADLNTYRTLLDIYSSVASNYPNMLKGIAKNG